MSFVVVSVNVEPKTLFLAADGPVYATRSAADAARLRAYESDLNAARAARARGEDDTPFIMRGWWVCELVEVT